LFIFYNVGLHKKNSEEPMGG